MFHSSTLQRTKPGVLHWSSPKACRYALDQGLLSYKSLQRVIENKIYILSQGINEKLTATDLLILDDFGLSRLEKQTQLDFMEIIEDRHARKATVIASQLPVSSWFEVFTDETLADSIIDRIVYTSHRFELKGERV